MKLDRVLITGERYLISRHNLMFQAMSDETTQFDYLPIDNLSNSQALKNFVKSIYRKLPFLPEIRASSLRKNPQTFIHNSQICQNKIAQLSYKPDLIFHVYGMFAPFWDNWCIPHVHYLDYTMALAKKNWIPWAPFTNEKSYRAWLDCEHKTYHQARHLFTISSCAKQSLIEDYDINPDKITVVHAAGKFTELNRSEKKFGSKQIIFNASDFKRKGGDILVASFKKVKQTIPEAKLIIVGEKLSLKSPGIENPGFVSFEEIKTIFQNTDLVVSPAYCEPFGWFLVEAMNYGIPCIVSQQDGMPEIVEHDVNGIVIKQPNPNTLAQEIINLLIDIPRLESMSVAARNTVATKFTWEHIGSKISQVLLNLE